MADLTEIVAYCDTQLRAAEFPDYCPNGLQVEGRGSVQRIASGVTASLALIEAAIEFDADLILVHHGYFWKGEPAVVTGMRRRRLAMLLSCNLSLLAYHLPLDAHPEWGNNIQLARRLGWIAESALESGAGRGLLWRGRLHEPIAASALAARIGRDLGRECTHIDAGAAQIETLAWCTGAAQGWIHDAVALGVDAYVSGEISESTVHVARECGIHYYAAGHHATERYGVSALGEHLATQFGVEHRFFDLDNPA